MTRDGRHRSSLPVAARPARRADRARRGRRGLGVLGPAERFEWSYADVAPALERAGPRGGAGGRARGRGRGRAARRSSRTVDGGGVALVGRDGRRWCCDAGGAGRLRCARPPRRRRAPASRRPSRAPASRRRDDRPSPRRCCARRWAPSAWPRGSACARRARRCGRRCAPRGSARRMAAAVAGYLAQLALVAGLWWTVGARAVAAGAPGGPSSAPSWPAIIAALVGVRLAVVVDAGRLAIDGGPGPARAAAARPAGAGHRIDARGGASASCSAASSRPRRWSRSRSAAG